MISLLASSDNNFVFFFLNDTAPTEIYTLSLHDALPISPDGLSEGRERAGHLGRAAARLPGRRRPRPGGPARHAGTGTTRPRGVAGPGRIVGSSSSSSRSEEHTSELQSQSNLVCRLLLVK